ncbi:MAG: hypothetical protein KZQ97_10035, partial [Candidatus Thiodiazotropha sp. (ex Dulcina madagascariensis)]|nr:hypothetical protein [Candidatus Thiodiazotropha sp. (ex Dulcina madagascariensis)]
MQFRKQRSLILLLMGGAALLGVDGANATTSRGNDISANCQRLGNDLLPEYRNTCNACHTASIPAFNSSFAAASAAINSGNYDYFCPPVVVGPTCTDADFDGYFAEGISCGTATDFNDNNANAYPGAPEICDDGIDNDGNGLVDTADANAVGCVANCTDQDGDRYSIEGGSCGPIDCDDNNIAINPGVSEICDDGVDNNCNARVDASDGACAVGFTHPFGWSNPEKSHDDYVDDNGVSECLSCHSIDTADRNSPLSCYSCHGKEWDDPNTGGGFIHPFGWSNPEKSHDDYVDDNGV